MTKSKELNKNNEVAPATYIAGHENEDAYKFISNVERATADYKAAAPQETPVYNSFESLQNRLPLTRRPFDDDSM